MRTISWYDDEERFHEVSVDTDDVIDYLASLIKNNENYRLMKDSSTYSWDERIAFREGYTQAFADLFGYYDLDDFIDYLCEEDDDFNEFIKKRI